jgi:hypothetical protein
MNENKIFDQIVDKIQSQGFDCFINNENLYILSEGFTSDSPLENILNLISFKFMKLDIDTIARLIITNHKLKLDIKNGIYDNLPAISDEDFKNTIINALNKNK